ncbi:MAG: winged helix-turn-helix domain-containing protein [Spirochaetales bacterium]|nr:winged helix-turn-helix domain-containing protein [Spirochaetales bacterium]
MNKNIFWDINNNRFVNGLSALMMKYEWERVPFSPREEGQCPPLLWLVEIDKGNMEKLVLMRKAVKEGRQPIIVFSKEKSFPLREECYRMGIDDYVEFPWSPPVVARRVESVLRRRFADSGKGGGLTWHHDGVVYRLDEGDHRLLVNDKEVELTPSQWNLFNSLILHGTSVVSRDYLCNHCLFHEGSKTRTLDNHMKNLRQNIGASDLIETVRGFGYRLRGEA